MNNFINWFTKKKIFFIGLVGSVGFFVLLSRDVSFFLYSKFDEQVINLIKYVTLFLILCLSFLSTSFVFFFSKKEEIFNSWKKTLFIYLFIYLLIIIITPWEIRDIFLPTINAKYLLALILDIIFTVFSIFYFVHKSLKSKKEN